MKKIPTLLLAVLLVSTLSLTVHAEEGEETTSESTTTKTWEEIQQAREDARAEKLEAREAYQSEVEQAKEDALEAREALMEEKEAEMEARRQEVCEQIQARVNNRLSQYEENKDKYHSRYRGIYDKITDYADKLDKRNCDSNQLRTDLSTFDGHIETFAAAFRVFVTEMQSARSYACEEVDTNFRNQVYQSREQVVAMQQAAKTLHNFVTNTFKPHMRQAHDTCQAQLPSQNE